MIFDFNEFYIIFQLAFTLRNTHKYNTEFISVGNHMDFAVGSFYRKDQNIIGRLINYLTKIM